jgi:hypothetical protein
MTNDELRMSNEALAGIIHKSAAKDLTQRREGAKTQSG